MTLKERKRSKGSRAGRCTAVRTLPCMLTVVTRSTSDTQVSDPLQESDDPEVRIHNYVIITKVRIHMLLLLK